MLPITDRQKPNKMTKIMKYSMVECFNEMKTHTRGKLM